MIVKENIKDLLKPKNKEEVMTSFLKGSSRVNKNSRLYHSYKDFFDKDDVIRQSQTRMPETHSLIMLDYVDEDTGEVLTFTVKREDKNVQLKDIKKVPRVMHVGTLLFTIEDIEKLFNI